jgi:hypothetical protein
MRVNNLKNQVKFTKNDPRINKKGRPKVNKTFKQFFSELENVEDDIIIPVESCELIIKDGKKFYKVLGTNGLKMAMNAYNRALKGDIKWIDFIVKMGYAGGYDAKNSGASESPVYVSNFNLNYTKPKDESNNKS